MTSQEEKIKHRKHLQGKRKKIPVRSPQAKALELPECHQRVIQDKRGRTHDLETLSHKQLTELIQEDN